MSLTSHAMGTANGVKKKNSQRRQKHTSARLTGRSFSLFFFFCSAFLFVLCVIAVLSRLDVQLSVDVLFSLHFVYAPHASTARR